MSGPEAEFRFKPAPVSIDASGRWTYGGEEIVHESVLALFRRCLRPSSSGGWELRLKTQVWPVQVEDTPFFVTAVRAQGPGRYSVELDDGTREPLEGGAMSTDARGVKLRVKGGRFPARFLRTATIALAHMVELDAAGRFVLPLEGGAAVDLSGLEGNHGP